MSETINEFKDKIKRFVRKETRIYGLLFSLVVYVIFAIIFTYPMILHMGDFVIGDLEGDVWKHLWGHWWVKKRIIDDGVLPLFTTLMNYPYGGKLFYIDPVGGVLSIPLQLIFPVSVAFNLMVIIDLVLGAVGGYLVSRYFVKNRAAAFYSGTVFAFTAYMLAYITSGVSETFNFGWLAIFIYFYIRMLKENREYLPILAGISFSMAALGSWYYGIFATLLGGFLLLFYLWYQYWRVYPNADEKKWLSEIARYIKNLAAETKKLAPAVAAARGGNENSPKQEATPKNNLPENDEQKDVDASENESLPQAEAGETSGDESAEKPEKSETPEPEEKIEEDSSEKPADGAPEQGAGNPHDLVPVLLPYVVIAIFVGCLVYLTTLPKMIAQDSVNWTGFWLKLSSTAVIALGSGYYVSVRFRKFFSSFSSRIIEYFYKDEPAAIRLKMNLLFSLYTFFAVGIFVTFYYLIPAESFWGTYRLGAFSLFCLFYAALMTYMQLSNPARIWESWAKTEPLSEEDGKKVKLLKSSGSAQLRFYARIIVPWIVAGISTLNLMITLIFYEKLAQIPTPGSLWMNVSISGFLLVAAIAYISIAKTYLKSETFRRLYIEPVTDSDKPGEIKKTIRRNKMVTAFLTAVLILPMLVYYFMGFEPQLFISCWLGFFLYITVVCSLIAFLANLAYKTPPVHYRGSSNVLAFIRFLFKKPIVKLLLMSVVILAITGPIFITFRSTLNISYGMVRRVREKTVEQMKSTLNIHFRNVALLIDYVRPGKENIVRTYTVDKLTRATYLGWITLILGVSSIFLARKRKYFWFWLSSSILAVTFSLGPFLYVTEDIYMENTFFLYKWMYLHFPFFNHISINNRFGVIVYLGMAVLAGYSIAAATRRWDKKTRNLAVGALAMAALIEVMLLSPAPYPIPLSELKIPKFVQEMSQDKEQYGVIDIPFQRGKGELLLGEYFYYQMTHKKGIPYKVEGTIPVYIYENQFTVYLFNLEKGYAMSPPSREMLKDYLHELEKNRIKYIIVHNQYLKPSARERVHAYLKHFLGDPRVTDMDIHVYKVY